MAHIRQFGVRAPWQWFELFDRVPGLDNQIPLVVCLHGSGVVGAMPNAATARNLMGFETFLNGVGTNVDDLFFVRYLQGLGIEGAGDDGLVSGSWNSGHMDNWSIIQNASDAKFIEEAVKRFTEWVQRIYLDRTGIKANVVDPDRRFLVGFGNGGCMAYQSAVATDYWKAFAVINGSIGGIAQENAPGSLVRWTPLQTTTRKALLHIHDVTNREFQPGNLSSDPNQTLLSLADIDRLEDQNAGVLYVERSRRRDLPVVSALSDWVDHNQGSFSPVPGVGAYGGTLYSWPSGPAVQYLEYQGGGHEWPTLPVAGNTAGLIWSFFRDGTI